VGGDPVPVADFGAETVGCKNSASYQGIVLEAAEEVLALAKRDPLKRGSIFSDLAALVEEVAEKVDMLTSAP
jgi:hypothetical protein